MIRRKLILANWKMHGSLAFNASLLAEISKGASVVSSSVEIGICAPAVYLHQISRQLKDAPIGWGVQDISVHEQGAFTGEISAAMVAEFDATYAIVGHSERRSYHLENDETVSAKTCRAIAAGLTPVVCVGETGEQRDARQTDRVICDQLSAVLKALDPGNAHALVVAYEPVWAIGTGRSATAEQAQSAHAVLRTCLREFKKPLEDTRILYGGSVKRSNAPELFDCPDVDGALVGGASLNGSDFIAIATAADRDARSQLLVG